MHEIEHMINVGAELSEQCKDFWEYSGVELCFYCPREDDCEEATALATPESKK